MVLETFLAALLLLLTFGYILSPLVSQSRFEKSDLNAKQNEILSLKKAEILDSLKDLDLDRHAQKISEEDYQKMRQDIMAEGVSILKKMSVLILFLWVFPAHAQMPVPIHDGKPVSTGVLNGRVIDIKTQKNLAGQKIALVVYNKGERVLMLDKTSDEKGAFQFKNIFAHPDYLYAIGTMQNENVYVMTDIALKPGENEIKIDFPVGEGSPYLMVMPSAPSINAEVSPHGNFSVSRFPQISALILSALVLFMAFYYGGKSVES